MWAEFTSNACVVEARVLREDNQVLNSLPLNQNRTDLRAADTRRHFLHTFYLEHEGKAGKGSDSLLHEMTCQRQT